MIIATVTPDPAYNDLGANHHMWTHADLWDLPDGSCKLACWTRTATFTWWGGYVGTVVAAVVDANGTILAKSDVQSFGVNGTWFGGSDRTEGWDHYFPASDQLVGRASRVMIHHDWRFEARAIGPIIQVGKTIVEVGAIIGSFV